MIRTTIEASESYEFTSQFFFDDALTDQVYTQEAYAGKGQRNTRNGDDNIYMNGGDQLVLIVEGDNTNDYTATINIGLDLTDAQVGQPDTFQGGGARAALNDLSQEAIQATRPPKSALHWRFGCLAFG